MNRRTLLKRGITTLAATPSLEWLLGSRKAAAQDGGSEPHYFLQVVIAGGVDPTYMFDARPLRFTDAGKLSNFTYKNAATGIATLGAERAAPKVLSNRLAGGDAALYSPLVEPLMRWRDQFTVVNGITMLLDGGVSHGQNMYYLMNGASVRGDSFVPYIGARSGAPLESVHIGSSLFGAFAGDGNQEPTNFSGSVVLSYDIGGRIGVDLESGVPLDLDSRALKYVLQRYKATSGNGMFSGGIAKLRSGLEQGPGLANALRAMRPPEQPTGRTPDPFDDRLPPEWGDMNGNLDLAFLYLKSGATSAVTLLVDGDPYLDVHDASQAQRSVEKYEQLVAELEKLFTYLNTKEGPGGRKLIDLTTVMIVSEFGRTMVKTDGEFNGIDRSGTDHNPLTNSAILLGKGINPGCVIGASDMDKLSDANELIDLPAGHTRFDPEKKRMMGKPFDFERGRSVDGAGEFRLEQQLTINSVLNTVMTLFGVDTQKHRNIKASDDRTIKAPVIRQLLKA